jgi:hypothetical protein
MKKFLLYPFIILLAFTACVEEQVSDPTFGPTDMPMIYGDWTENLAFNIGDTIRISVQISPSDGATYKWIYNGVTVSTEKNLEYEVDELGNFTLQFEVDRNGIKNSRIANVLVVKPFEPKTYNKKSVAFITVDGSVADVPWDNITHLIVSSAIVGADGTPDLTFGGRTSLDIPTLILTAHNYGVFVLLEFSGAITYLNAAHAYGNLDFYHAATGADNDALVSNMVQTITNRGFDGINVYMDKADDGVYADPVTLKTFYEKLGNAMKSIKNNLNGIEYDYLLSMSVYGGWTSATLSDMVNILTYDWINVLAFAAEDLMPTAHSAPWYFTDQIAQWINTYAVAPARIVGVAPAFGLRYFGNISDYTWGNLWEYTAYTSYRTICNTYTNAHEVNQQAADNGLFYDGLPAITEKAQYVINNNLAGMGLWSLESDSSDPAKSLMKQINTSLGN